MTTPADFLTTAEVAELLRCSDESVRRAIRSGDLEAVQFGHVIRIRREAFDAFLQQHTTGRDQLAPRRRGPARRRAS